MNVLMENLQTEKPYGDFFRAGSLGHAQDQLMLTCKYCCWSNKCGLQPPLLSITPWIPLACDAYSRAICGWLIELSEDEAVIAESGMALLWTPRASVQPGEKRIHFKWWKVEQLITKYQRIVLLKTMLSLHLTIPLCILKSTHIENALYLQLAEEFSIFPLNYIG